MITISGRSLGSRRPLFEDFSIPFPPDDRGEGENPTVRDLIARVVRAEVAAFRDRRESRKLDRVLSPAAIAEGAARGKIDPEGKDLGQAVDDESAVDSALQAFEDGLYMIVVDGEEKRDLDQAVRLQADSRLTFIRLALLAGG